MLHGILDGLIDERYIGSITHSTLTTFIEKIFQFRYAGFRGE